MGTFKSIRALFEPAIGLIRYMPATAFVPLLLIWLGLGESPKIALDRHRHGVLQHADDRERRLAGADGADQGLADPRRRQRRRCSARSSSRTPCPGIIDAARVNLAAAWNLIVVAELLAAEEGLGFRIIRAQKFLHIDQIFVVLVVIGVLGVATDIALRMLRNRLAPWSQE